MVSKTPSEVPLDGPVAAATRAELVALGAAQTLDGARALNLASVLDDRAGIQAGGVASTDKQLGAVMESVRAVHKPKGKTKLELLRGGNSGTAG
jgi:hypothetical protein